MRARRARAAERGRRGAGATAGARDRCGQTAAARGNDARSLIALLAPQINPYVSELALYDIAGTPGVAADLSHINTKAAVKVR